MLILLSKYLKIIYKFKPIRFNCIVPISLPCHGKLACLLDPAFRLVSILKTFSCQVKATIKKIHKRRERRTSQMPIVYKLFGMIVHRYFAQLSLLSSSNSSIPAVSLAAKQKITATTTTTFVSEAFFQKI